MKKFKIISNPTQLSRAYLDSLNDIDDYSQEVKAERFQARRWRSFRQEFA